MAEREKAARDSRGRGSLRGEEVFQTSLKGKQEARCAEIGGTPFRVDGSMCKGPRHGGNSRAQETGGKVEWRETHFFLAACVGAGIPVALEGF